MSIFLEICSLAFETSNAQVNERYICISNNNIPQALALVQIIELSVDVILKNIKVSPFFRKILNAFFCNDHIKIMFCGNVFLSGEHGISFSKNSNRQKITVYIGNALDNSKDPLTHCTLFLLKILKPQQ